MVASEDAKENEGGDVEGGDGGVEEDLENKELPEDEIGEVERPKKGENAEDADEE